MSETLHNKKYYEEKAKKSLDFKHTASSTKVKDSESKDSGIVNTPSSGIDSYSQEVINSLIGDGLPVTPNNFALYFDRLLENKSENFKKEVSTMLELEEHSSNDENIILLEKNLKQGFSSVKNMLNITANLYKNISLMMKIIDKRKKELNNNNDLVAKSGVFFLIETDMSKLNTILQKQNSSMKKVYESTASIVRSVENETIFDNQFGVYNKRYLINRITREIVSIKKLNHPSSLIFIELSRELVSSVKNAKEILHMTKIIARLLLKTSRRSDLVAYYGDGKFAMLLQHTDIENAKRTSARLCDLVSDSNIFIADREMQLKISIGIADINISNSVEEIIVKAMDGIEKAYEDDSLDYAII
ncbi:MAG: diguanylate cyclase [Campylobacterota bacterium]|nr:diguanylate cyclase [Campylobacterota bacterium]